MIDNLTYINKKLNNQITLVAVSKAQSFEAIKELYDLGVRNFGESYVQELLCKINLAKQNNINDIIWHFLGNIQSNKIKSLINIDFIHSISKISQLDILDKIALKKINYFLQINLLPINNRLGFLEEEIFDVLENIKKYKNLKCIGLMCVLPSKTTKTSDYWFEKMFILKQQILEKNLLTKVELSMGMSDDFIEAIKYGSTFVRIGSRLFGKRVYK